MAGTSWFWTCNLKVALFKTVKQLEQVERYAVLGQ